jgi:hypothetical protein
VGRSPNVSRWLRAQQSLHQEKRLFLGVLIVTCLTCGATPCHNPTFCAACRAADRRAAEARQRQSPFVEPPRAARSTFDACLFELREYGINQLADPSCRRRLADLSSKQVAELLTVLVRLRPRYPNITDDLLFELGEGVDDRPTT